MYNCEITYERINDKNVSPNYFILLVNRNKKKITMYLK